MKQDIERMLQLLGGVVPSSKSFVPLTEAELNSVESDLGVRFPEDYRDFLHKYGAAAFGELVEFSLLNPNPVFQEQGLQTARRYMKGPFSNFYGSKLDKDSLLKYFKVYRDRMPETIIPIADDGAGNQVCIGISGKEHGKVYYWDHHNEWDEEDYIEQHSKQMPPEVKFQNVYLIAESFEDFIRRLQKTKIT